ncbi:MAG: hypothetical protein ACT4QF_04820 [Sporichthyaceae bacterium]
MDTRIRFARVAPRLLMLAAVLLCMLGSALAVGGATAASAQPVAATVAAQAHGAHAQPANGVGPTVPAAAAPQDDAPGEGHGAHGGDGHQSSTCMPGASATTTAGVSAAPVLETVVLAPSPVLIPAGFGSAAAALPRPPDLRSLCVQRV